MKVDPIVCSVKPDSSIGIYCSDIDGDPGHIAELEAKGYKVYKTEDACKLGFRIELGSKGTIKNL